MPEAILVAREDFSYGTISRAGVSRLGKRERTGRGWRIANRPTRKPAPLKPARVRRPGPTTGLSGPLRNDNKVALSLTAARVCFWSSFGGGLRRSRGGKLAGRFSFAGSSDARRRSGFRLAGFSRRWSLRAGIWRSLFLSFFRLLFFFHFFRRLLDARKLPEDLGVILGLARPAHELRAEKVLEHFVEFGAVLHADGLELDGHARQPLAQRLPFVQITSNLADRLAV